MQAHLHNYFRLPLRLLQTYKFHSISRVDTITTVIITIVILTMIGFPGNDSNLLIVFYVQIMPDDFVMQLHRF